MNRKSRTLDRKKRMLLKCINNSPGIRYRELLRATGFPNGVIAYHLKILEKLKQVKVSRHYIKTTRYYPLKTTAKESRIIEFMKRPTDRRIILVLLKHEGCLFTDIQRYIKKASSTVSYHLSRLRKEGIISVGSSTSRLRNIKYQRYRIRNKALLLTLIEKVKL